MIARIFKIVSFLLDEEIDMHSRMLRLAGTYTVAAIVLAMPLYALAGYDVYVYYTCLLALGLMVGSFTVFIYTKNAKLTSIVFSYVVNFIVLPLFFVFTGGFYGGLEIVFVCGIIDAIFLLEGELRVVSAVAFIIWHMIVMGYCGVHPEILHNVPEGTDILLSFSVCMLYCSLILMIVIFYENRLMKTKQRNISIFVNSKMNSAETKSRFLANMSHELRTPMNAVLGMTSILEKDDREGVLTEELSIIDYNAKDLLATINSILDYSKLESEKFQLANEQFEFTDMLRGIIRAVSEKTVQGDIDFFLNVDPTSPNILYGDYVQIERVISELLDDAINSASGGRVVVDINGEYSDDYSRARYTISISDTGYGIKDTDLESIYSSYETYDSRQDSRIKRLGLKYSVFRGILQLMNGDLKVSSIENVGTNVRIIFDAFVVERLPMCDTAFTAGRKVLLYMGKERGTHYIEKAFNDLGCVLEMTYTQEEFVRAFTENIYDHIFISSSGYEEVRDRVILQGHPNIFILADVGTPAASFPGLRVIRTPVSVINLSDVFYERYDETEWGGESATDEYIMPDAEILVVDDNMVNLKVAQSMLEHYEVKVSVAESGFGAIEQMKEKLFDMVLMDQVMPGMDGFEAMHLIRNNITIRGAKVVPILCLTADNSTDIKERAIAAGFNGYLAKPIQEAALSKALISHIHPKKLVRRSDGRKLQ